MDELPEYQPLACPAPSIGVSQDQVTRAYQAGVEAGDLLAGRSSTRRPKATPPGGLTSQCWVVLVECNFSTSRPFLHHITGREVPHHERVREKDMRWIFHGFSSALEAWAYLAGAGFAPQHVVERPMRY